MRWPALRVVCTVHEQCFSTQQPPDKASVMMVSCPGMDRNAEGSSKSQKH